MLKTTISILIIIVPVITFGILNKTGPMATSLIAGFLCAVIINLDRFKSFKAGSIEAQLRHTEDLLNETNTSIEELKEIAEPLMNYTMANIVRGHTFFGLPPSDREDLYLKLRDNSAKFNIKSEYNKELLEELKYDVVKSFLEEIGVYADPYYGWSKEGPLNDFKEKHELRNKKKLPPVNDVKEFFKVNSNLLNEKVRTSLLNYERTYNTYISNSQQTKLEEGL